MCVMYVCNVCKEWGIGMRKGSGQGWGEIGMGIRDGGGKKKRGRVRRGKGPAG